MTLTAYKDHPIRTTLDRILGMQSAPEFSDPSVAGNEIFSFARDKIFSLAETIKLLLQHTPAILASTQGISQIQANLQGPLNELTAFLSNKNPEHIVNAGAQFDQNIQPLLWSFSPQTQTLKQSSLLSKILDIQAEKAQKTIDQLVTQRNELQSRMQGLSVQADEYATRLESLKEGAVKERAEAAATVAKLDQAFAERETERAATFEAAVKELRDRFKLFESQSIADSDALIVKLEAQKDDAARIVQVVGNIGVTGNYQQIANAESAQANFWRWITVAIFGAGIAVAVATFVKFWGQPFNAENAGSVVIRLLYAIAITAPAWYTARESARHRTNSDRARQTELELASIGPFIELMPDEKKFEIREELIKSYFGNFIEPHTANQFFDASTVKNLLMEFAKSLKK